MKKLSIVALLLLLLLTIQILHSLNILSLRPLIDQIRSTSPLLFIFIYALAILLIIPSAPLNLLAGTLYGPLWGSLFSLISTALGSTIAFFISRHFIGEQLTQKAAFAPLRRLLTYYESHPWATLSFLRVNPLSPTSLLNYLIGATSVSFSPFFFTTFLFGAPPTIALAYTGSLLPLNGEPFALHQQIHKLSLLTLFLSFVFLLLPLLIKRLTKRRLSKRIALR